MLDFLDTCSSLGFVPTRFHPFWALCFRKMSLGRPLNVSHTGDQTGLFRTRTAKARYRVLAHVPFVLKEFR